LKFPWWAGCFSNCITLPERKNKLFLPINDLCISLKF
jgi:hypothetical protein